MRKSILFQSHWLLLMLTMIFFFQYVATASNELEQINRAITEKGANWIAAENWVTKLSPEERKRLCGSFLEPPDPSQEKLLSIPLIHNLPPVFDWRDNNGNWVTPVKNQGNCGSCWDFSAVGQVEAWWKIHHSKLDSMIDLSEQFVLSCSNGSCDGWFLDLALEFISSTGVPTEACFEYKADDTIPCSDACSDWESEAIKIPGWGYITLEEDIIDNIKSAVYRHPVSAAFTAYEDFDYYAGGVYEYVWGDVGTGHAILIVGWNDEEQSWICKNSWSPRWGEQGYFRIKWSNCGIGSNMPFIWDEMTGGAAITISPDQLKLYLTVGDSVIRNLTVNNVGINVLEFSAMDYVGEPMFHPDSFMAYDNSSWWCGDPQIGGYENHWLQYLDMPILDLSNTIDPHLSWMGFWSIENPVGAPQPWDGWDGCNIWVSIDGGRTFKVADPISPEYNCQSLWSFGGVEGWNMGIGIAGWGGSSGGWTPVEYDLSLYKSDSVIIRYAFASDMGLCTKDDPLLYGFFVDEIIVSDGRNVLFEDHAHDIHTMQTSGYGGSANVDWIDISDGAGVIQPNGSTKVGITIRTRNLTPGSYNGLIHFTSNDTTLPNIGVPLRLELCAPDHDIAVEELWLPGDSIPIFTPINPSAEISNCGLYDETDLDVVCTVLNSGHFYSDTTHIPILLAGESEIVKFKPFTSLKKGKLNFEVTFLNIPNDDYNSYNNRYLLTTSATNLVDDFETETGFWALEGGWGITEKLKGHDSDRGAHVNNGSSPYSNNMNTTMTFTPGFDLHSVDKATLMFWTKYYTEQDKDICYVEVSGDNLSWTKLDSLSGAKPKWTQRQVSLVEFIKAGYAKVWLRFHFVSDSMNTGFGVLIDDVEIYPERPTDIQVPELTDRIATKWNLAQNYPNPFNMTTRIEYSLPKAAEVTIAIYNIRGQVVRTCLQAHQSPGHHFVVWDGCDDAGQQVGTGIYMYHLEAKGHFCDTKKLLLMK